MANWPDAQTARIELRRFLNDGPEDKSVSQKQVVGPIDGVNMNYLIWEGRIVPTSLFLFVNGVALPDASVVIDDAVMGQFHVTSPISAQSRVRAQYFYQYWLDGELDEALVMATQQINTGDDVTTVQSGLKPAALNFAGYFAYNKLAQRWISRMSSRFLLEDEPVDNETVTRPDYFSKLAKSMYELAIRMRNDFYQGQGRQFIPSFAVFKPYQPPLAPRR